MSQMAGRQAGRVAAKIAEQIKGRILSGDIRTGQYLPGVRDIGREHNVSPETARRAMKIMELERWVRVHPGHGFKVTAKGNDPTEAAPVAFILSGKLPGGQWTSFGEKLLAALHAAAEDRGWSMLSVGATGRSTPDIVEQLKAARASGLVLDTPHHALIKALVGLDMPVVMIEEADGGVRLDCVSQDNFAGSAGAAGYLAARGHSRIGWFGSLEPDVTSRERWGGALAAMRDTGASLAPADSVNAAASDATEKLRALLARPDRPTALLALWWEHAALAARTAMEAGLEPGRDVEIAGWSSEEQLPEFRAAYPGGRLPATVTWSMRQLAETALARLAERRARPDAPPVRINVETQLLEPEKG